MDRWALEGTVGCQTLHTDYGVDYFDTFSPVARLHSLHILLSVVVVKQCHLYQLDIKNGFLDENLQEVYMFQPSDYEVRGETNKVYKLKKAIHDLKQSPRVWFDKFSTLVAHYGLRWSSSNHYIFVRYSSVCTLIFAVYIDVVLSLKMIIKVLYSWKLIWGLIFIWKILVSWGFF